MFLESHVLLAFLPFWLSSDLSLILHIWVYLLHQSKSKVSFFETTCPSGLVWVLIIPNLKTDLLQCYNFDYYQICYKFYTFYPTCYANPNALWLFWIFPYQVSKCSVGYDDHRIRGPATTANNCRFTTRYPRHYTGWSYPQQPEGVCSTALLLYLLHVPQLLRLPIWDPHLRTSILTVTSWISHKF